MRTLLTLILSRLTPARGRRRLAPQAPTPQGPAPQTPTPRRAAGAATRRLIVTRRAIGVGNLRRHRHEFVRGEDVLLVRPYLTAHERAHGIHWWEAAA
ncbi:hypothetical protein LUX05_06465 [Streptomyces somaliensis]|uniref:hypothetical protein n=1 Tax=Streptomyces somaliensis TaxID=78355 RepID=UPI0034E95865|nr:hypothetical protein [Streptomyces somaliensis]MCP9973899.1 hypothetical protein [Streptomyces somaliensis]